MGSDLHFDYSVLGDSVNLASRLEGQSKEYGFPIIVGSKTAMAVKDNFAILELDFIMVKGKKEPEVIYAIAGREDVAQSGRFQRLRNLTIEMLACYRSRDWDGALAAIERGRKSDDGHALASLYKLYEVRIRSYIETPPPEDWNGAYALLTKSRVWSVGQVSQRRIPPCPAQDRWVTPVTSRVDPTVNVGPANPPYASDSVVK